MRKDYILEVSDIPKEAVPEDVLSVSTDQNSEVLAKLDALLAVNGIDPASLKPIEQE